MLPDFPEVKRHAGTQFLRAVTRQIPVHEPILRDIRHTRVHEGRTAKLTRADRSTDQIEFQKASAELSIGRDHMRRITLEQLMEHAAHMAKQLAGQQVQLMIARLSEAVDAIGNSVSAKEIGAKEAFLEMERRIQMEFDPETLEPKNLIFLLHPDQVESFKVQAEEWEKDPEFVSERTRIRQRKLEEWRARENRRQLAD